jgi:hypothetical protein
LKPELGYRKDDRNDLRDMEALSDGFDMTVAAFRICRFEIKTDISARKQSKSNHDSPGIKLLKS